MATLKVRRGTQAEVLAGSLSLGELGFATDTKSVFIYDGVSKVMVGRSLVDTLSNRPSAGLSGRFFFASDTSALYVDTGATWISISGGSSSGGKLVQRQQTSYSTQLLTTTAVIPSDDTIPQNTEGVQILSKGITPQAVDNIINVSVFVPQASDYGTILALFQNSNANASAAAKADTSPSVAVLHYAMTVTSTASITFTVRIGCMQSGKLGVNRDAAYVRNLGGVMCAYMVIDEISL